MTEIYDYLRLLFCQGGPSRFAWGAGSRLRRRTVQQMVDVIGDVASGGRGFRSWRRSCAGRKGEYRKELADARRAGYVRARIDGTIMGLDETITLDKQRKHTIEIVVDRLVMKDEEALQRRLADSVETALKLTQGLVGVLTETNEVALYSEQLACITCGVSYPEMAPRVFSFNSPHGACPACDGIGYEVAACPEGQEYSESHACPVCRGTRLRAESLAVKVGGKSIAEVTQLSIREAVPFFGDLDLSERERMIGQRILKEIRERLEFLLNVGLDYLTLDRAAATLSGGEGQRIRLATQIGSGLVGVLYILDEPSIGLHQRDNHRLLQTLLRLRDLGNTVLVVEHDAATMRMADHIVDMGPRRRRVWRVDRGAGLARGGDASSRFVDRAVSARGETGGVAVTHPPAQKVSHRGRGRQA